MPGLKLLSKVGTGCAGGVVQKVIDSGAGAAAVAGCHYPATGGAGAARTSSSSSCSTGSCYAGSSSTLNRTRSNGGYGSSTGAAAVGATALGMVGYLASYAGCGNSSSSGGCSGGGRQSSGFRRMSAQDYSGSSNAAAMGLRCCGISGSSSSKPVRPINGLQGQLLLQQQQLAATVEWRSRRRSVDHLLQQLVAGHAGADAAGVIRGGGGGGGVAHVAATAAGVGCAPLGLEDIKDVACSSRAGAGGSAGGASRGGVATATTAAMACGVGVGGCGSRIVLRSCSMPASNAAAAAALVATISGAAWGNGGEKGGGQGDGLTQQVGAWT